MQMNQEMQKQGRWLFRWRSYLPLLFFVLFIPAFLNYHHPLGSHTADLIWESVCLFIGLCGLAVRCLVIGYAPQRTSGRNTKEQIAETLNTKGMYSLVRNPLYLGNFLMWSAPVLFFHSCGWWLILIYVLAFVLYYERIIITEETFLFQKFGEDYARWASETPAFFPKRLRWQKPELPFSWKTVVRREYHGLFGLIAAMTAVELTGEICLHREFIIDPVWLVIFIFGTCFYLTVRFFAKCTNILHTEGR
ncbi:MAG: isoprenylcysteine carboxylmethyltransferase family protein [Planctomycetaceae bacterium]|jgi:protein-S-isoprenylcysteine O-methyltransferase Ste14|nr:isoprenylcysteine carboxylmethyltransferase family protein [Planctomycetaceae bacterium]